MFQILCRVWILPVQICASGEQIGGGDFPGSITFLSFIPPADAVGEFLELNWRGLGTLNVGYLSLPNDRFTQTGGTLNAGTINTTNNSHLTLTNYVLGSANGSNGTTLYAAGFITANTIAVNSGGSFIETSAGAFPSEPVISSFVDNGGTVQIYDALYDGNGIANFTLNSGSYTTATSASGAFESIGYNTNGGTASFNQTGGTHTVGSASLTNNLYLGYSSGTTGIYNFNGSGSQLTVYGSEYVGNSGAGIFNQSGGTHTVGTTVSSQNAYLGFGASSSGTYLLSGTGSQLDVNGAEYVGYQGTGVFNQTGGAHTVGTVNTPISLNIGYNNSGTSGTYLLSGNTSSSMLTVIGSEVVGSSGNGVFKQSGGTHTVTDDLVLANTVGGTGSFTLSGGSLAATTITPNFYDGGEYIATNGTGTFIQTGGSNTANKLLDIGLTPQGAGSYTMSDATGTSTLTVNGNEIVGDSDYGIFSGGTIAQYRGIFNQSAGTNVVTGSLSVATGSAQPAPTGLFMLSGTGSLAVGTTGAAYQGSEIVGASGTGVFNQSGGTNTVGITTLSQNFYVGYYNVATGTYTMSNPAAAPMLTVNGNEYIGEYATGTTVGGVITVYGGTFNQSGGAHSVTQALVIGDQTGSTGLFLLSGGNLSAGSITVGNAGTGQFVQTGGNASTGTITINANSSYTLGGGMLTTPDLEVGSSGTFNQTTGTLNAAFIRMNFASSSLTLTDYVLGSDPSSNGNYINAAGTMTAHSITVNTGGSFVETAPNSIVGGNIATLTDNNGTVQYFDAFSSGPGIAQFVLTAGTYSQGGAGATTPVVVGYGGSINQSGGTFYVGDGGTITDLHVGDSNSTANPLSGTASYLLTGTGALNVSGNTIVGFGAPGIFTQNGAATTVTTSQLSLGGANYNSQTGVTTNGIGTYLLQSGSLMASSALVGDTGFGTFNQTGGTVTIGNGSLSGTPTLSIGNQSYASGFYFLDGASSQLTVNGNEAVGYGTTSGGTVEGILGVGIFTQNNGNQAITGNLSVGDQPGSAGLFALNGGKLLAGSEYVGYFGSGPFNQSGGTNTITNFLDISKYNGGGVYTLSGSGQLSAASEIIDGSGIINQSGGTNVTTSLGLNSGTYFLSGSGSLLATSESAGLNDLSGIVQTGGTNTINGSAGVLSGEFPLATGGLVLGEGYSGIGSYSISGASSQLSSPAIVVGDTAVGQFTQQGGTVNVSGALTVGRLYRVGGFEQSGTGSYNQSGGSLSAATEIIGDQSGQPATYGPTQFGGTFTQSAGTNTITGSLILGNTQGVDGFNASYIASGYYALSGTGSILSAGTEIIGNGGATGNGGVGVFNQTGGTNSVAASFSIGAASTSNLNNTGVPTYDTYNLLGGTLNLPATAGAAINYGLFTLGGTGTLNGYLVNNATDGTVGTTNVTGFYMTGGTVASTGTLEIAAGGGQMSAGNFAGTAIIDAGASFGQSGGTFTGALQNDGYYTLAGGVFSAAPGPSGAQNDGNGNFTQNGGTVSSTTFINQGTYSFQGGTFTGRMINEGTLSVSVSNAVFGNGLENEGTLNIPAAGTLTFGGQGLDNFEYISIPIALNVFGNLINEYGATLATNGGTWNGTVTNEGTLSLGGPNWTVSGAFTNSGLIGPLAAGFVLHANSGLTNSGDIELAGGQILGGSIINNPGGLLHFFSTYGATTTIGITQAFNNNGGVINVDTHAVVTFSSFAAGNINGGDIQIQNGATLTATPAFPNSGTIELLGSTSALNGGAITNTGSLTGIGRVSNPMLNSGTLEAKGGLLQFSGAGSTDLSGSQIIVDAASTVQYSQGLAANAGTISLLGGTFDNNSRAMTNTGIINGTGTFKTGGTGLNNSAGAIIDITAGTSFFGNVSNSGYVTAYGAINTFYGNVTDTAGGGIKITNGSVYFLGNSGATVAGIYNSDPSDNYFNGLAVTSTGTVTGGTGDRFFLLSSTPMTTAGTFTNAGTLSVSTVSNSGTFTQTGTLVETGNFNSSGTATIGGTQNWSHGSIFTNTAGTTHFTSDTGATGYNLTVKVTGGSVTFGSTQHLAALNVSSGGLAQVTGGGSSHRLLVYTPSLSVNGKLDLTGNDLDVQAGNLTAIRNLVAQGYNNGHWTGTGIDSSSAAGDTTHLTALGVIQSIGTSLDGSPVAVGDVLVKYTYCGDANLDGKIDGSDYSRIDAAYLADKSTPTAMTGWYNGDFNYDGVINGSDYTLIDNAFNTQEAQLDASIASPNAIATAQIAGTFSSASAVPEPTSIMLLGLGTIAMLGRRRRNVPGPRCGSEACTRPAFRRESPR